MDSQHSTSEYSDADEALSGDSTPLAAGTRHKRQRMDKITDVSTEPLGSSNFVKPLKMCFSQNGKRRRWDLLKVHDSVAVLIHNTSRNVLVFVRQFRPPVYLSTLPAMQGCRDPSQVAAVSPEDVADHPGSRGVTLELCAGCVDKDKSLVDIARDEVREECGYDVPADQFRRIQSFVGSVGLTGSLMTMFYATVTDELRTGAGGGNPEEGELIEVVEMTPEQLRQYVLQEQVQSPPGLLFCVYWFFMNILKQSI